MESEGFEVWRVTRDNQMGVSSNGPDPTTAIDPFYECMDCPMYVDFTKPDQLREEDFQAWFDVYVDREVGKPRSYPLFRDPAMDIALSELEVERLLKAGPSKGLRPLQPPSQNVTPLRQRPSSGGSSSPSESPPGSCSPTSVLRPSSYRRRLKPGGATSLSRSLDFGKSADPSKPHASKHLTRSVEMRKPLGVSRVWEASGVADVSGASGFRKPLRYAVVSRVIESRPVDVSQMSKSRIVDVSQVSMSRPADVRQASVADVSQVSQSKQPAESRRLWPTSKSVDSLRRPLVSKSTVAQKPLSRNTVSENFLPETRRASEPRSPPTCKRYMLPTATSIRKQDHKSLKLSADGPGGSSQLQKPMWQPPSPVVRRTSSRHPTGQSSGRGGEPSKPPREVADPRRACYLQKQVGEERKAKLSAELSQRGPVGALCGQQPGGLSSLPGGMTQGRFDSHQQAPLVLAL